MGTNLAAALGFNPYLVQPPADHKRCSADTRVDAYRPHRAINAAGAAFHTAVQILNYRFARLVGKHGLGAYPGTHLTSDADILIQPQTGYAIYISKFFHILLSTPGQHQRCSNPEH